MEYFAYGSNMDAERMRVRVGEYMNRRFGVLEGYRLCFNKAAQRNPAEGYANIVPDGESVCEGILYTVDEEAIQRLDQCEGYPTHYNRVELSVKTNDTVKVGAVVYIAQRAKVGNNLRPSREYIAHLLAGRDLLSASYIREIELWPTVD